MSKLTVAAKRFGGFMKKNAMYFLILLTIASVATVIALAATGNFNDDVDEVSATPIVDEDDKQDDTPAVVDPTPSEKQDDDEPVVELLTFAMPCNNGTIKTDYSTTALAWNATLSQYSTHLGLDIVSDDLKVLAVADGIVSETGYDTLDGYYVVVAHNDNYQSRYYSLDQTLSVKKGDKVQKGQVIGTMSSSMAKESLEGNHLHLEMSKNGEDINPLDVIVLETK